MVGTPPVVDDVDPTHRCCLLLLLNRHIPPPVEVIVAVGIGIRIGATREGKIHALQFCLVTVLHVSHQDDSRCWHTIPGTCTLSLIKFQKN